jgi:CNT family concentrative nucleoside transporter
MNWRLVAWGVGLQMLFALIIFRVPVGATILLKAGDLVTAMLAPAQKGAQFLFGPLASPDSMGFIIAFQVLPTIIFFSALVSILYYFGIMQIVIRGFARVFSRLMRISGAESLCAASNIFVGIESALTVRPFLLKMTRSELCAVLTTGMATVASSVLVSYVGMLKPQFPAIASHLISASILSAPAALVLAKIMVPEDEKPVTLGIDVRPHYEKETNIFEAVINGANSGLRLIGGIIALLVAVLGLVGLIDLLLGAVGVRINNLCGISMDWSLTGLLSLIFYPFSLVAGVHPTDAAAVAHVIAQRTVETEFVAYMSLGRMLADGTIIHPRSAIIASYALCGFAHFASVGIFVGGVSALVPERIRDISRLGLRALVAATLACLMTACMAGAFLPDNPLLFSGQ